MLACGRSNERRVPPGQRTASKEANRVARLEREEGADWFVRRQRFLATTAELAASRRLSRFLYLAEKPEPAGAAPLDSDICAAVAGRGAACMPGLVSGKSATLPFMAVLLT